MDLLRGLPGERPKADRNIAALPIPDNDPIYGLKVHCDRFGKLLTGHK